MTLEGLKDSSMKVLNKDSRIVYVNKGQNPRALYEHQIEVQKKLNKINKRDEFSALLVLPTGSGKSLSMVFYARLLNHYLDNPTYVIITDRNDLDEQLYGQFSRVKDFLRQSPVQASSRVHLKELLEGRRANGIFFTTMQKFSESKEPLSDRNDIIVIADEAHRSQYGLKEKMAKDGSIRVGMARIIRDSLPRASYIGFTGTPVSAQDKDTQEVFGDYIDIYDMTQSVEDGATKPIYYENRVMNLGLDEVYLEK